MEMVHGTLKASEFSPEDVISSMPYNVISNILDCMPIQDAVGTSILSRNWRYKWTTLTRIELDVIFFEYLLEKGHEKISEKIISRLLLHVKGDITEFILYIPQGNILDVDDINHWILFLSGKRIKEFTLKNGNLKKLKVPTHLFSCLELQHLVIYNCCFHRPPSFHGFPNLLRLNLYEVTFETYKCGEIITRCPSLEKFVITDFKFTGSGVVKLDEIEKLENISMLSLYLCMLEDTRMIKCSSIFQHFCLLPKLQELELEFEGSKFLAELGGATRATIAFPSLETLTLSHIDLSNDTMLSCALEIIFGSPNLRTLDIEVEYRSPHTISPSEVDYNRIGLLQLRTVVFKRFSGSHNEICLIKCLLACSHLLKKISIYPRRSLNSDEMLIFAAKLLKFHRASTTAEIGFYY